MKVIDQIDEAIKAIDGGLNAITLDRHQQTIYDALKAAKEELVNTRANTERLVRFWDAANFHMVGLRLERAEEIIKELREENK